MMLIMDQSKEIEVIGIDGDGWELGLVMMMIPMKEVGGDDDGW